MTVILILAGVALLLILAGSFLYVGRRRGELEPGPPAAGGVTTLERPPAEAPAAPEAAEAAAPPEAEAPPAVDLLEVEVVEVEGQVVEVDVTELVVEPEVVEAPTFRSRLARARSAFAGAIGSVLGRSSIDDESWDDVEEALIRADVGVGLTQSVLDAVRARVKAEGITTPEGLVAAVRAELRSRLAERAPMAFASEPPTIWLFVGVNGVGKTTTIGKVGRRLADDGHRVVMAAGDTFRAAAAEQLATWAERSGAELVRGDEGGDPSAVIFDGVAHAAASGADVVLADTAGRLHTKSNLMEELRKVRRVADKGAGSVTEVLLVLDATTGQNGLAQARQFAEAVDLTGVVLTKLDGSAKGGIVFAIESELGIPVKLVGLGETAVDLVDFDPDAFVDALFEQ
jgi:fused signal recognition particle receptor